MTAGNITDQCNSVVQYMRDIVLRLLHLVIMHSSIYSVFIDVSVLPKVAKISIRALHTIILEPQVFILIVGY